MLDRLMNNRKEWNALKEVYEAKMAAIEAVKRAKEEDAQKAAAARQGGKMSAIRTHTTSLRLNGPCASSCTYITYCVCRNAFFIIISLSFLPSFCLSSYSECSPVEFKDLHSELETPL